VFTLGACVLLALVAWYANRTNEKDRSAYDRAGTGEDGVWHLVLHIRQDLKLIAFSLAAIIVMLGIIADRLH
jgi:hypothetical protein